MKLQARIFRDRRASWVLIGGRPGTGKAVAEATREQGKALVAVDLAEVNHIPMVQVVTRSPDDHQAVAATLKARIETLEADLAKLEASAAVHRADFERERTMRAAHGRGAQGCRGTDGCPGSDGTDRW
jgi:NAD(P)-dependent dehydrogenase (short-subunit alcohol dehydrogenase family)